MYESFWKYSRLHHFGRWHGKHHTEHDKAHIKVIERSRQIGVKLNYDKLQVAVPRIKYFGHILTPDGTEPDPNKISAIQDMSAPTNKAELETIFGMINYLSNISPKLSEATIPMHNC